MVVSSEVVVTQVEQIMKEDVHDDTKYARKKKNLG